MIVVRRRGGNCEEIFVEYAQQRKKRHLSPILRSCFTAIT